MRKMFAACFLTLPLGLGCQHTGGECDCAPIPGDSAGGYNPHLSYHAGTPGGIAPGFVGPSSSPISTGRTDAFEPIGPPKAMPKVRN